MDFPANTITNVHVIDGFSNIYWRIYTEEPASAALPAEGPANGYTILKHLSRLKRLELHLRNFDCLVSCYPRRLGLWVFSATPEFGTLKPLSRDGDGTNFNRLTLDSVNMKVAAAGTVSAADLMRSMSTDPQMPNPNASGAQRSLSAGRPGEGQGNQGIIYAAFISAVTSAMSLQLVRRHNAIPLGSRTLFTAVERNGYDSPILHDSPDSVPSLTTLRIELTPLGKLIISLHTISQHGITRLWDTARNTIGPALEKGQDIWLAPTGTIARLISAEGEDGSLPSPGLSNPRNSENATPQHLLGLKRKNWKENVVEWIRNVGLPLNSAEDESWIEVEVPEPFYSRLAAESMRQTEGKQPSPPLRRLLWPAKYSFTRTKTDSPVETSKFGRCDPIDFATEWFATASARNEKLAASQATGGSPGQQPKGAEMSTPRTDAGEVIESLARVNQYPDLQAASLVYPTPPDGALTQGFNNAPSSDSFAEVPDAAPSTTQNAGRLRPADEEVANAQPGPDVMDGFGTSTTVGVGSGLYDEDDDDDLFEEMNGKDFGSKGITDADFSFFDEPDIASFDNGKRTGDAAQEIPQEAAAQITLGTDSIKPDTATPDVAMNTSAEETKTPVDGEHGAVPTTDVDGPKHDLAEMSDENIEDDAHINIPDHASAADDSQTISPPLSPVKIKRILFSEVQQMQSTHVDRSSIARHLSNDGRNQSHYGPVPFQKELSSWDQKYGAAGTFSLSIDKAAKTQSGLGDSTSEIPTIGLPRPGRPKPLKYGFSRPMTIDQDTAMSDGGPLLNSTSASSDETTDDSDDDYPEGTISPTRSTAVKRKRGVSEPDNDSAISQEKTSLAVGPDLSVIKEENSTFLGNFFYIFSDWSLAGYFSVRQNRLLPVLVRKEDVVQLAQLMVDQVTQSSLTHKLDEKIGLPDLGNDTFPLRTFLEDSSVMGETARLDLKSYVEIQQSEVSPTHEGQPPRQRSQPVRGTISKLATPHLRIRRGKDFLEVLPPAISFWETFGLEPAHGEKDILAYCIHPQYAAEGADAFLERLSLLYSSCGLGKHARGGETKDFENGLGPWKVETSHSGYTSTMQDLKAMCERLGNILAKRSPTKDNYVIYIINPFEHAAALADICAAFLQLFQKYIGGADRQDTRQLNELVLQIVPMSFVWSPLWVVVPTQSEYLNLALEVYNRCPPRDQASGSMGCAPPLLLAEPTPRSINFKLVSERISPLQEGKCLHVSFSRSIDQRWVTVAWSDNIGSFQVALSYCLRSKSSNVARAISDVRHEIWETTKDIIERTQARWRVLLAKTEPVDQEEIEAWTNLAERYNQTRPVPVELTIFSVDTAPDLYLELPPSQIQVQFLNAQSTSTPVATPNPSAPSPDPLGTAATPTSGGNAMASASTPTDLQPVEPDSDTVLVDICDESWGVILSHRLNNSPHLTEYRPALASGYLLRRKGTYDGDGAFAMTINLVYTQRPAASHELLLKEVLGMYRDLATLARYQGIASVQRNTLPWHIATAIRGQEMLSYVL
ncbi:hypothetical protein DTO195F2_8230 [Paecilomyces variotii]|nr:hypothetical protein DTO195F2_8230 [Paecilomyces variotii]